MLSLKLSELTRVSGQLSRPQDILVNAYVTQASGYGNGRSNIEKDRFHPQTLSVLNVADISIF